MSNFVPDGWHNQVTLAPATTSSGGSDDAFAERVRQVLADPVNLPNAFKAWMQDYSALNIPLVPASQIIGFTQFTAKPATSVTASEATSSASYADMNTVGPTVTGLLDGSYVFLFGATATPGSATVVRMSLQYDSTAAVDGDSVLWGTTDAPGAIAVAHTLSGSDNHTVTCKYLSDGTNSVAFQNRWLIALRYATA